MSDRMTRPTKYTFGERIKNERETKTFGDTAKS